MPRPHFFLLLIALLAAAPAARAGELRGTVRYAGPERPRPDRAVAKDREACGPSAPDESLLVNQDRLANVVVEVRGVPGAPPPARGALAQVRCRFAPRVQALPVGSTLSVGSSDAVLHSVHGWRGRSTAFHLALARPGEQAEPQRLLRPGRIQVRCDVHDWMAAWIAVVEGPAAVSGADGRFAIGGLPPGSYTLVAWHERLGERTAAVVVPEAGTATVELDYSPGSLP